MDAALANTLGALNHDIVLLATAVGTRARHDHNRARRQPNSRSKAPIVSGLAACERSRPSSCGSNCPCAPRLNASTPCKRRAHARGATEPGAWETHFFPPPGTLCSSQDPLLQKSRPLRQAATPESKVASSSWPQPTAARLKPGVTCIKRRPAQAENMACHDKRPATLPTLAHEPRREGANPTRLRN